MKTKIIPTGKAIILVVDLPKDAKNPVLMGKDGMSLKRIYFELKRKESFIEFPKIGIDSYLIGFADQLTEEQVMDIVPNAIKELYSSKDYINSLLKANGIVTMNPLGSKPTRKDYSVMEDKKKFYEEDLALWTNREAKLWTNPVILLKQD